MSGASLPSYKIITFKRLSSCSLGLWANYVIEVFLICLIHEYNNKMLKLKYPDETLRKRVQPRPVLTPVLRAHNP